MNASIWCWSPERLTTRSTLPAASKCQTSAQVVSTLPSPPADRRARWGAAGPARTAPGIGRGPTPGTCPSPRRSPRGRRRPPPTPAAGPQQLRQLNAAWFINAGPLPRNAIDSSRARTLTRIGVARRPQADQRAVTTGRRNGRRSRRGAVGGGQRRSCPGRGGGGRPRRRRPARRCRSARRPRSGGHLPEQFGPGGQRLAALADAGLHGQVARTGPCRVAAGQGPDGRTVMGRTARAAPS